MSLKLPIYTALSVPTTTTHPSIRCLQWSGDGQVLLCTKSALYILTPDPGINFDTPSVIKAPMDKERSNTTEPLGWFRTMIEFEKLILHQWPLDSQDWGAVSLGSLDVVLRAATFSPSNVNGGAGCVIAAINSNTEVTLWGAVKNHLRGEWIKLVDVTAYLKDHLTTQVSTSPLSRTLQAQTICIAWSRQTDFGIAPTPNLDGSLLAAGNRGGSVIFLKYVPTFGIKPAVAHAQTISIADKWITHLVWSSWTMVELGKCEAYLACGCSDGSVTLIRIVRNLDPIVSATNFGGEFDIQTLYDVQSPKPVQSDKQGITALTWVEGSGGVLILAVCKPGIVHLWPLSGCSWSGIRLIHLQTQKVSVGSSSLSAPSGVVYVPRQDVLLVSLQDGSFHVIHHVSSDPILVNEDSEKLSSAHLSRTVRSVLVKSEAGEMKWSDVGRISGMSSYDSSSTVAWVHEACRPADYSYKHDARHNSMLVVAQLWDDITEETILEDILEVVTSARTASGYAPIHVLRSVFLQLRSGVMSQVYQHVLAILHPTFPDESTNIFIPMWSGILTEELRRECRSSLARHLYGWDPLLSLRLRLAIADYCWKFSASPKAQEECGQVAQLLLNAISHRIQRTLIRHLAAIVGALTSNDIPFVMRIVVQSSLPGSPPDLSAEAQELSNRVMSTVPIDAQSMETFHGFEEFCPACNTQVQLQQLTSAVCPNGHVWARCSITSFILATPTVRTCIGCSRKAFMPHSQDSQYHLPTSARGWFVQELLEAAHHCLFCGNSFVNLI
ncbi:hypothetical protein JAAARDRAFT_199699 [Jaapia argillacea MUCL 33604]|uniref:Transcription factor IIIC 90kDa subunit N-terminal domain-containing protein n=1 Tax=Jaapia argillacea MUCL 33604 TaxID=933084 RepID=A0A067P7E2_9AGAM|nr:hypothetical protein JAAARDRAFT_199699 [Jaapia argillacea MUCL 33604]